MKSLVTPSFIRSFIDKLSTLSERFPLAVLLVCVVSVLLVSETGDKYDDDLLGYIFPLSIAFFISVGLSIGAEIARYRKSSNYILQWVTLLFVIWLYYYLDRGLTMSTDEFISRICISFIGAFTFLLSIPYLVSHFQKIPYTSEDYYGYFYTIILTFGTSIILVLLFWALWSIGIASIDLLFNLWSSGNSHLYWGIFSTLFCAPLLWLTQLPPRKTLGYNILLKSPFILFIVRYVLVPFMYVYFCILYAYLIKILALPGEWPNGRIPWMIIGFSSLGYSVYILSRALSESRMVQIYQRYLPWVVFPQILFLFYAIALRIEQYDLTMNRYLVVAFGLWLTGISLYYVFSREKSIGVIPVSLLVSILLIAGGPWSFQNLAESRQYERFLTNLTTAGILRDGVIYSIDTEKLSNPKLLAAIKSQILTLSSIRNGERLMELRRKVSTEVGQCLRSLSSFPEDKQARLRIHWICVLGEGVNE